MADDETQHNEADQLHLRCHCPRSSVGGMLGLLVAVGVVDSWGGVWIVVVGIKVTLIIAGSNERQQVFRCFDDFLAVVRDVFNATQRVCFDTQDAFAVH